MTGERKLLDIPLSEIRENPVALRNVDRTNESYLGLVDSIRTSGVLNAIVVREITDPETKQKLYGLIDGLHRFSASKDAGRTTIPAQVIAMADAEVLEAQVVGNLHKIETKPVEYSRQLVRILAQNPLLTTAQLCQKLSKSPTWLNDRLGLTKLDEAIGKLVDGNEMNLSNAYALAKLPPDEQAHFVDRALTMSPQEFVPTASTRAKEIANAKRAGRDAAPPEFVPVAHVRKIGELKAESESPSVGPALVRSVGATTATEGFALGLLWALHMDPASIQAAKDKDAARKQAAKDAKDKRDKEREEKKNKDAAETAAKIAAKTPGMPVGASA